MSGIDLPPEGPGTNKNNPRATEPAEGSKDYYKGSGLEKYNQDRRAKAKERRREEEILREAVKRYKKDMEAEADNRAQALEDLKFKAGKQWPADIETERAQQKRPCLTINGLPTFTHQVANDIRQNRQGINLSPTGDESTKEAAELYASFIRGIERDSAADIAYDTAVGSAIDIGFGYWRYMTEYESPETFNQVVVVKRVRNAFTVVLDHSRQEPDGSDAKHGFISEMIDRDEFRRDYPNAREVPWRERGLGEEWKEWSTKDQIRIAEYYAIEYDTRRLVQLENGHTGWYDELDPQIVKSIEDGSLKVVHDRESEIPKVVWRRITSAEILDERPWAGKWIPIVEVIGDEIDVEGKVVRSGIIRNAKDPMRMKNYWATAATEVVALAPKTPYILAEGQDEGYEDEWSQANTKPLPVIHYVPVKGENGQMVPPPARQSAPQVPSGMVEREKQAEQDLMRTTGIRFDASVQERMYDESGKAIKELRRSGDIGSFHYSDNFSRSLRHGGRILLDLCPKIYDTERFVTSVAEDGNDSRIKLDPSMTQPVGRIPNPFASQAPTQSAAFLQPPAQVPPGVPPQGQMQQQAEHIAAQLKAQQPAQPGQQPQQPGQMAEPMKVLNLRKGEFVVTVTTGPSYATRRIEAQEQMAQFIGKVPESMRGIVAALMAKYSDWPGSTELYKALVKTLPPGVFMPDPKDLSPAVAAFLNGLQMQIKQLMTERMQLLRDLTEKRTEHGLMKEKIDRDFDAKVAKILVDFEKTSMQTQSNIKDQIKPLFDAVQEVVMTLKANASTPTDLITSIANGIMNDKQPGQMPAQPGQAPAQSGQPTIR